MATVRLAAPGKERARTFPGEARQVSAARQFVARALAGCPARECLLACVSELAANAVEHTDSGSGGTFTVEVGRPREGVAFVAVSDEGGPGEPGTGEVRAGGGDLSETGRGLALVAAFSNRWGWRRTEHGHQVWAEATWPVSVRGPGGRRKEGADVWPDAWTNPVEPRGVA